MIFGIDLVDRILKPTVNKTAHLKKWCLSYGVFGYCYFNFLKNIFNRQKKSVTIKPSVQLK